MTHSYEYARACLSADCVVFAELDGQVEVLLIQRGNPPYQNQWALPGGFMEMNETLEDTARRELLEETGVCADQLTFVGLYDRVDRDPRDRVITAAYIAVMNEKPVANAGDDAASTRWFNLKELPELAFDHQQIIDDSFVRFSNKK